MDLKKINFWNRLNAFIENVTVHDMMAEEEKSMIMNVCKKQINAQKKDRKNETKPIYRQFSHLKLYDDEFEQLLDLGYTKQDIDCILDKIENSKLHSKYRSLFLTAKNWLQNDKNWSGNTKNIEKKQNIIEKALSSRERAINKINFKYE